MNKKWLFHGITVVVFVIFIVLGLASTGTTPPLRPSSVTKTGPRTIILNDEKLSEDDVGGFISWFCYDSVYEEKGVLLEVGTFGDPKLGGVGYILYDGGYIGELTYYRRTGLEHRWDWGPNDTDYAFVIKSDGTGLYYDFSNVRLGESTKARDVFKCYKK